MTRLPDISVFYTPERAKAEEVAWIIEKPQARHAAFICPRIARHDIRDVVEFGCGAGILASKLPENLTYTGIDANPHFLDRAKQRCSSRSSYFFSLADLRDVLPTLAFSSGSLAVAIGVLKHFSPEEWPGILAGMLRGAEYGCFDVQLGTKEEDDGTEFHHVFTTDQRLEEVLAQAEHTIVDHELVNEWTLRGDKKRCVMFWTHRTF